MSEQKVLQKIKKGETLATAEEVFEAIKLKNEGKVSEEELIRVIPVVAGG